MPLSPELIVVGACGALFTVLAGVLAWNARETTSQVRKTADTVIRIETQVTGGEDGSGGLRGEVREIKEVMRRQADDAHARLGEWTVWRTGKDKDDAHRDRRLAAIEDHPLFDAPRRRQARRRTEDR